MGSYPALRQALICFAIIALLAFSAKLHAQPNLKKIRIGVSETHVGYLPLQVAYHKGYYKDEGIDLEIVLMPTNIINTAALTGQIDINGAVTGTVGAAVQGSPIKLLIVTVQAAVISSQPQGDQRPPRVEREKNRRQLARWHCHRLGQAGLKP